MPTLISLICTIITIFLTIKGDSTSDFSPKVFGVVLSAICLICIIVTFAFDQCYIPSLLCFSCCSFCSIVLADN